jgi:uncharacterized protein YhbP (UPF0306 family)
MNLEQIIKDYISSIVHLSLATSENNKPWVCEVHYAYDDDLNLYFRSKPSRRHSQEIAKNPYVAGNIVKQHALGEPGVGVYFEGEARVLETDAERATAFSVIRDRLKAPDSILPESQEPDGHHFYKITINTYYLFGAFDGQPAQKYTLSRNTAAE